MLAAAKAASQSMFRPICTDRTITLRRGRAHAGRDRA